MQSTSGSKTYYIPDMQINVKMRYILGLNTKLCKVKFLECKKFVSYHVYTAMNNTEKT
jgi:hypothetical protein